MPVFRLKHPMFQLYSCKSVCMSKCFMCKTSIQKVHIPVCFACFCVITFICTVYARHVLIPASTLLEHVSTTMKTNNHTTLCTQPLPFLLLHISDLPCQPYNIEHIHHMTGDSKHPNRRMEERLVYVCVCV